MKTLGVAHAVVTSVNRDELPDGGAAHFAATIREIRALAPGVTIEVLIPDFLGSEAALGTVLDARPEVLNHNTETVERLYRRVRPDAVYARSLELLRRAATWKNEEKISMKVKSGVMVGLGETRDELSKTLRDLRANGVEVVTVGQYLQPHARRLPIERYYTPAEFEEIRREGEGLGFLKVESGPLVRSSYHARRALLAVVADRFDRAGVHRFLALGLFLGSLGLLHHVREALVFLAGEVRRRRDAADVAVDTLRVDVEFSRNVLRVTVVFVRHPAER